MPQSGSDDVYLIFAGLFQNVMNTAVPLDLPISAEFAASVPNAAGGKPDRLDSAGVIDMNYWITRVLGPGGTGGALNIALANAALYAIGWDYGLPEVENGEQGPYTNFSDPNVALINHSNAMVEGGDNEGFIVGNLPTSLPISDTAAASFTRFNMMQDGFDVREFLRPGTLGNPPIDAIPPFPLPPPSLPTFFPDDFTANDNPSVTTNSYDLLANDPDIGANPDVAYVTGTGAFDQIFITKLNATQAQVTVKAYSDSAFSHLITSTGDGEPLTGTMTYTISLQKQVIPGRLDDGQPFRIIVDGCDNNDQIFLDPTLGVEVDVHGGADVKTLKITGNGAYNLQYTPTPTPVPVPTTTAQTEQEIGSMIPDPSDPNGLIPGAGGTLVINGSTSSTTTTKTGTKVVTKTVSTPFTTTVVMDQFSPVNASALRLENFNALTYKSPGFLNNEVSVTNLVDGAWQIDGQVDSPFFPPSLTGNIQFTGVKQLLFDTTKGTTSDTVSFATNEVIPAGLQSVNVNLGTGVDSLNFDDSKSIQNQDYVISPTLVQPVLPLGSTFAGFSYSGVDLLSVAGTAGDNKFLVSPSKTTSYSLDGGDPARRHAAAGWRHFVDQPFRHQRRVAGYPRRGPGDVYRWSPAHQLHGLRTGGHDESDFGRGRQLRQRRRHAVGQGPRRRHASHAVRF